MNVTCISGCLAKELVHNTRDLGTYRLSNTLVPLQYTRSFCVCVFSDAVIALIEYRFSLGTNLKWSTFSLYNLQKRRYSMGLRTRSRIFPKGFSWFSCPAQQDGAESLLYRILYNNQSSFWIFIGRVL